MATAVFVSNRAFGLTRSRLPLMSALANRGFRVVAMCEEDHSATSFAEHGIEFTRIGFARRALDPLSDARVVASLAAAYTRLRPTLVHHFNIKPIVLGRSALRLAPGVGPTIVATVTGLGYLYGTRGFAGRALNSAFRLTLPGSDQVVFQNHDDQAAGRELGWLRSTASRVIVSSGVDCQRFQPPPKAPEGKRVLFVGRLLKQKGIDTFLALAARCKTRFPDLRFEIAGEKETDHPDAFPYSLVEAAVARGEVRFLGYVSDMEALLRETWLVVMPSQREGTPRVVLEASACGVPSLGADVPGTREAIRHGETGFLAPHGDVDAMLESIDELCRTSGLRDELGRAARVFTLNEFDTGVVTDRYLELYDELLARRGRQ